MTHFATEGLLVSERSGQISSENADQSVAVKFAPTKETTLCQISGALAGQANAEPAETLQAMEITTTEAPASSGNIRWWDLFFIAFNACLGWAIFCFLFSLVAGLLFIAMGYGTDLDAFATAASENFYYTQVSVATFCLALLVAIRRVLRKRRGRGSFVSYFRPIGGRRLLYAALSGLVSYAVGSLLLSVLWSVVHWRYHPPAAEVVPQPYSLGQLAISGLTGVVLAPLTEEIYFRGLLLEWFQQRLALFPSALITAAIFALYHFYFLQYPGSPAGSPRLRSPQWDCSVHCGPSAPDPCVPRSQRMLPTMPCSCSSPSSAIDLIAGSSPSQTAKLQLVRCGAQRIRPKTEKLKTHE